jgi:hypothetical protein
MYTMYTELPYTLYGHDVGADANKDRGRALLWTNHGERQIFGCDKYLMCPYAPSLSQVPSSSVAIEIRYGAVEASLPRREDKEDNASR